MCIIITVIIIIQLVLFFLISFTFGHTYQASFSLNCLAIPQITRVVILFIGQLHFFKLYKEIKIKPFFNKINKDFEQ